MMKFVKYVLLLLVFCSCYSEKKATRQINKAAVSYPRLLAVKARDMFPCIVSGDTLYITDSSTYLEALTNLQLLLDYQKEINDSLNAVIQRGEVFAPSLDTLCANYKTAIAELKKQNDFLIQKLHSIPPIRDTMKLPAVRDNADLYLCEADRRKLTDLLSKSSSQVDIFKAKAKKRGIIMWSLIGLIVLVIGLNIYFKVHKIPIKL